METQVSLLPQFNFPVVWFFAYQSTISKIPILKKDCSRFVCSDRFNKSPDNWV